jgi:hypothetical protein
MEEFSFDNLQDDLDVDIEETIRQQMIALEQVIEFYLITDTGRTGKCRIRSRAWISSRNGVS